MKKLFALLLVLCLALPAFAEDTPIYFRKPAQTTPVMQAEVAALQTAHATLMDTYGLTLAALGLFDTWVDVCGDTAIVTYRGGAVPESLTGAYFVIVTPDGTQAMWTHDGTDVPWQSGELTSPVWGMPQLQQYLDATPGERYDVILPYFPAELNSLYEFEAAGGSYQDVNSENHADADTARGLAAAAVLTVFPLTEAQSAQLASYGGDTRLVCYPDGHGEWEVMLHLEDGSTAEVSFYVTVHAESWEILDIEVISGGIG